MGGRALAAAMGLTLIVGNAAPDKVHSDYAAIRAAWAEARIAARADAVAALPKYDALVATATGNEGVLLSAIAVAAAAQDHDRLKRWLGLFVAQGGGLSAEDRAELAAMLGTDAAPVLDAAGRNTAPLGDATVVATLPGEMPLIEGVTRNPRDGAVFVSSVIDRRIVRVSPDGARRTVLGLAEADGFPMGLAFDHRDGTLWAAVDSALFPADKPGAGGVMRIAPGSGEHLLIGGEPGAALHIGDIALAADGSIYAADSRSGAIYRCARGCTRLSLLVAPGRLRSAQGMAPSPDGKRIYVADYAYGLLAIDTRDGTTTRIDAAAGVALDGIDGLAMRGKRLIAIQNGWAPARVIELNLDSRGTIVTALRVLARGAPVAVEPGQFALGRGGEILMVANSQWGRLEKPEAGRPPADPTRLVRLIEPKPGRR